MARAALVVAAMLLLWPPVSAVGAARTLAAPSAPYTITDLGALGGGISIARGVNASGRVVGDAVTLAGNRGGFIYDDGAMRDLAPDSAGGGAASAINDAGQVAGSAGGRAALFQADGTPTYLGTLGGPSGTATGINARGHVAGQAQTPAPPAAVNGIFHAFVYADGAMRDLGTLPGGSGSSASAINDAGDIVGVADTAGGSLHAFLYRDGGMRDLGELGTGGYSAAAGINEGGQIVGAAVVGDDYQAFIWEGGAMRALGLPPGFASSGATAINNAGEIVGTATTTGARPASRAILWQGAAVHDLNTLLPAGSGWALEFAYDINDLGQIVGAGTHDGKQRAFLLSLAQCFPETGRCIGGRFLARWQQHGGLAINGYPIGAPFTQTLEDGKPYAVQYFERVRMELHPENAPPNDVLLGQFGRLLHPADPPVAPLPRDGPQCPARSPRFLGPEWRPAPVWLSDQRGHPGAAGGRAGVRGPILRARPFRAPPRECRARRHPPRPVRSAHFHRKIATWCGDWFGRWTVCDAEVMLVGVSAVRSGVGGGVTPSS